MTEVRLDPRQAPARAELLLAANVGRQAAGHSIHCWLKSEDGGGEAGPRLKLEASVAGGPAAVRTGCTERLPQRWRRHGDSRRPRSTAPVYEGCWCGPKGCSG